MYSTDCCGISTVYYCNYKKIQNKRSSYRHRYMYNFGDYIYYIFYSFAETCRSVEQKICGGAQKGFAAYLSAIIFILFVALPQLSIIKICFGTKNNKPVLFFNDIQIFFDYMIMFSFRIIVKQYCYIAF